MPDISPNNRRFYQCACPVLGGNYLFLLGLANELAKLSLVVLRNLSRFAIVDAFARDPLCFAEPQSDRFCIVSRSRSSRCHRQDTRQPADLFISGCDDSMGQQLRGVTMSIERYRGPYPPHLERFLCWRTPLDA